jgi:hypothetical protein
MPAITADDHDLLVHYKVPGKVYNSGNAEAGTAGAPFDEYTIKKGDSWTSPIGATILRVKPLGLAPEQGGTPEDVKAAPNAPVNEPSEGGIATPQGGTPD